MLLTKGFEVEVFTATSAGEVVGFSDQIVAAIPGFVREPDNRNVEYTTPPYTRYEHLFQALLEPRQRLRHFLRDRGGFTLLPGSTLALGGTGEFHRSDPQNPYHAYIESTYGTAVVTASIHINIGIAETEALFRACRLLRLEAPLYLALSASSPFLDGRATGSHSSRWQMFPKTPSHVPLFTSHGHYITWTYNQLQAGAMQNVRHLWTAVRPNGDNRPYDLNRLELRICDLVLDPIALLAITALLECRLVDLLRSPDLDPLVSSPFTPDELLTIADQNEAAAARSSLDAPLVHWQTGETIPARDWIADQYHHLTAIAKELGNFCFLTPLQQILNQGNDAQQWLAALDRGETIPHILRSAIQQAEHRDRELSGLFA